MIIFTNSLNASNSDPYPYFLKLSIFDIIIDFIKDNEDLNIVKQAILCLGNLIAGNEYYSKQVISTDILPKLISLIKLDNIDITSNICHLLANLILDNQIICTQILINVEP